MGTSLITPDDVEQHLDNNVMIVDIRAHDEWRREHIAG